MDKNIDDKIINEALLGSPEASVKCTEAGVAIPCPFCGGTNLYIDGYDHGAGKRWRVVCLDCMAMVDPGTVQQKYRAIEAWNRRVDLRGMGKEAPQQWIPVGERLPEHTGHVLILSRDPYGELQVNISAYTHIVFGGQRLPARAWMEPYECFSQHDTVTHWMPLPRPPLAGGDT